MKIVQCIFCDIVGKKIPSEPIHETDACIVISDIHPQAPVHLLIIPKAHYAEFLEMPNDLLLHILETAKIVIANRKIAAYRLVNNGKGAAMIDHFHLHILGSIEKERGL